MMLRKTVQQKEKKIYGSTEIHQLQQEHRVEATSNPGRDWDQGALCLGKIIRILGFKESIGSSWEIKRKDHYRGNGVYKDTDGEEIVVCLRK